MHSATSSAATHDQPSEDRITSPTTGTTLIELVEITGEAV